jgi:hypothetical protein
MVLRHKKGTRKCALKACKIAREAVKLTLNRRDTRRTRQFRYSSIQKKPENPELIGNKVATVCLIEVAASPVFEMIFFIRPADGGQIHTHTGSILEV